MTTETKYTREYMESMKLATEIQIDNGYLSTRVLPDGSIAALVDLLFTRAIVLGCNRGGYAKRFCFKDRLLATERFWALQSEDDEPQGFVARRPEIRNKDGSYVGAGENYERE